MWIINILNFKSLHWPYSIRLLRESIHKYHWLTLILHLTYLGLSPLITSNLRCPVVTSLGIRLKHLLQKVILIHCDPLILLLKIVYLFIILFLNRRLVALVIAGLQILEFLRVDVNIADLHHILNTSYFFLTLSILNLFLLLHLINCLLNLLSSVSLV